jgi:Tol biopolymer transport system component
LSRGVAVTLTDKRRVLTGMPSVSPDGKWIAFAGQENKGQPYDQSRNSLWLVDEAGAAHTVESNPGQGRAPTWSPSGEQLAFESTRGSTAGLYAIFVINRDGSGLVQITDRALNADHPVWSPDGRQLAFSAHDATHWNGRSIGIIEVRPDRGSLSLLEERTCLCASSRRCAAARRNQSRASGPGSQTSAREPLLTVPRSGS